MSTTEVLNTRIKQARQSKTAMLPLEDYIHTLNLKLTELARQQRVIPEGTVESIFPYEDRSDERGFHFEVIASQSEIDSLSKQLERHASPKER